MREIVVSDTWRGRIEALIGRRCESWAIGALVVAVAAATLALWSRSSAPQIAPPATSGSGHGPGAFESQARGAAPPSPTADVMLVHVAGAVRRPGLYELAPGARVADAVEAAGGPTARAELDLLNLAEALADGQKVEVLTRGAAAPAPAMPASSTPPAPGASSASPGVVDINVADQAALESIPEVGPVTAQAIHEYRSQIGSVE